MVTAAFADLSPKRIGRQMEWPLEILPLGVMSFTAIRVMEYP